MSASIYESFFFLYATQPGLQHHINKFEKQILQWDYFYSDLHHIWSSTSENTDGTVDTTCLEITKKKKSKPTVSFDCKDIFFA